MGSSISTKCSVAFLVVGFSKCNNVSFSVDDMAAEK